MTDAPERIWIESRAEETAEGYGSWDCRNVYEYDLEYVRADLSPAAVTVKPLEWSDIRDPDGEKTSFYTHVVAETPLGSVCIEWKGWKDHDSPTCDLPWPGGFVCGDDLEHCKALVQLAFQDVVSALADTPSPGQPMTNTTTAPDLIERLRGSFFRFESGYDITQEAAEAIEAAQARIAELEEALERIDDASNHYAMTPTYSESVLRYAHQSTRNLARAALQEDKE